MVIMTLVDLFSLLLLLLTTSTAWNTTCPKSCICTETTLSLYRTVDCSKSHYLTFPINVPISTEVLILSHCKIISLPNRTEELLPPSVTDLDLSSNSISHINPFLWENGSILEILDMSSNKITSLLNSTFDGLDRLLELHLGHNSISYIDPHAFSLLQNLRILDLADNEVEYINREWFLQLLNLQKLDLSYNKIPAIPANAFSSLDNLNKLSLTANKIRDINKTAFNGLILLDMLYLDRNQIYTIPTQSLGVFKRLSLLTMDANPLHSLDTGSFRATPALEISLNYCLNLSVINEGSFTDLVFLQKLQLHDNHQLKYIDPSAFINLPMLQELILHNNALIAIPSQILQSAPALEYLTLYNNPVRCDCNIHWLLDHRPENSYNSSVSLIDLPHADEITCDSPIKFKGMNLLQLPPRQVNKEAAQVIK